MKDSCQNMCCGSGNVSYSDLSVFLSENIPTSETFQSETFQVDTTLKKLVKKILTIRTILSILVSTSLQSQANKTKNILNKFITT